MYEGGLMFYSAETAHEVDGSRYAITIWYYDYKERDEAIKIPLSGCSSQTTVRTRRMQRHSLLSSWAGMRWVMVASNSGRVGASEEITISDAALGIVSSITGAPSVQSFRRV